MDFRKKGRTVCRTSRRERGRRLERKPGGAWEVPRVLFCRGKGIRVLIIGGGGEGV